MSSTTALAPVTHSRRGLSVRANRQELEYRQETQWLELDYASPNDWWNKIEQSGRLELLPYLQQRYGVSPGGHVIEVGAGSCWLTAQVSRDPAVESVTAVDFSERLLKDVAPVVCDQLGADTSKIVRQVGDMFALEERDASVDWVLADSVLHHTSEPLALLHELARVLRPGGHLLALREPVMPRLPWCQSETERDEHMAALGITEGHYPLCDWRQWFEASGLRLRVLKVNFSRGWRGAAASLLNGWRRWDVALLGVKW